MRRDTWAKGLPGKPVAHDLGLLWLMYDLVEGAVALFCGTCLSKTCMVPCCPNCVIQFMRLPPTKGPYVVACSMTTLRLLILLRGHVVTATPAVGLSSRACTDGF